jgi:hypothetical protein
MPKRIEILNEMVPQLRRLALIAATAESKTIESVDEVITFVAGKPGFAWERFQPIVANDYDEIFARLATF